MSSHLNALGQPVGEPVPEWSPPPSPSRVVMEGRFCRLEPVDPGRHSGPLHAANQEDGTGAMWTYLPYGPFLGVEAYRRWMEESCLGDDPLFMAIIEAGSGDPVGLAANLRIDRANGVIEIGHLAFAPRLQRTSAATEAMCLMMSRAFELGYRRCEWKCDALNQASRTAAERLGFAYEGTFRQAVVRKGHNRDTAWYSIIDREWPARRAAFERWLSPENFDAAGHQRRRLADLA